jgi:hypothetical protein
MLLVALALIGWCWNRGLRATDRVGLVPWQLLVTAYALVLVLRHFQHGWLPSVIIAAGVVMAGLLGRSGAHGALWIPVMLLAALLGLGLNLSFIVLTVVLMLVLLFSAGRGR